MPQARIIDAPGFPAWDVSCPARNEAHAAAAVAGLAGESLIDAAEVGPGAFVNLRWSTAALLDVAREVADRAAAYAAPPPCRACRRADDYLRMAHHEHGPEALATPVRDFAETRPLLVRVEAALATQRADARDRLMDDVARRLDALHVRHPLLRGSPEIVAGRATAMAAAAAAMRWAAASGWRPGAPAAAPRH